MLYKYKQLKISEYSSLYDIVVTPDNLLRKIKDEIDFSFVNILLAKSYCEEFGRPAKEPELMFKLMFLKRLYDLSNREVFQRGTSDMAFKYFLDLEPEDKLPHHSLLTKFKNTRINSEEILNEKYK